MSDFPPELKGNKQLATQQKFGLCISTRRCSNCSFRGNDTKQDCEVPNKAPKNLFSIGLEQKMPTKINDAEVALFCPYFTRRRK